MIQGKFLLKINKKYWVQTGRGWFLTAFFHKIPTFSPSFGRKKLPSRGNVTRRKGNRKRCYANRNQRLFHRGEGMLGKAKYLLKTHSFPHSPQTFPQGFSTGFKGVWKQEQIDIKRYDRLRRIPYFFAGRVFYHSKIFVQKLGLDKGKCGARSVESGVMRYGGGLLELLTQSPRTSKIAQKFLKKGVDFVIQMRYNMNPYGKLTKEEV